MLKRFLIGITVALAISPLTTQLRAQSVIVSAYFSPSSPGYPILGYSTAYGSDPNAWITLEMTLWRGSAQQWTYREGPSYVAAEDSAPFEAGQNYYLEALACGDWGGSHYDCNFSTDYYQAPGAPIIGSIDPTSVQREQCYTLQIYGENLELSGVQTSSGEAEISNVDAYYNQITCTLCISAGAPESFLVWAINGNGASNTKSISVN